MPSSKQMGRPNQVANVWQQFCFASEHIWGQSKCSTVGRTQEKKMVTTNMSTQLLQLRKVQLRFLPFAFSLESVLKQGEERKQKSLNIFWKLSTFYFQCTYKRRKSLHSRKQGNLFVFQWPMWEQMCNISHCASLASINAQQQTRQKLPLLGSQDLWKWLHTVCLNLNVKWAGWSCWHNVWFDLKFQQCTNNGVSVSHQIKVFPNWMRSSELAKIGNFYSQGRQIVKF